MTHKLRNRVSHDLDPPPYSAGDEHRRWTRPRIDRQPAERLPSAWSYV
jgi:hypothetical protein